MATARDLAIIIVAVESIIIGGLLIYLIFLIRGLVKLLKEEVKPILDSTQETVGTVKGTTAFLSETLVNPVIQMTGFFVGLRRSARVLFGGGAAQSGSQPDHESRTKSEEV